MYSPMGKAMATAKASEVAAGWTPVEPQNLEAVLRATESLMAYQRAYHERPRIDAVLALLLLDATNPRSLAFQLGEIQRAIAALAHDDARVELAEEERLVLDAATSLRLADLTALAGYADGGSRQALDELLDRIGSLLRRTSDVLTRHYFIEVRGPQHLGHEGAQ